MLSDISNAGVYSRREPLCFISDLDKRDLVNVFSLDKKIQITDIFFHNVNSTLRIIMLDKNQFSKNVINYD